MVYITAAEDVSSNMFVIVPVCSDQEKSLKWSEHRQVLTQLRFDLVCFFSRILSATLDRIQAQAAVVMCAGLWVFGLVVTSEIVFNSFQPRFATSLNHSAEQVGLCV